MSASVSISDLFRVLLPRDHPNGWLVMIPAYFDDSGTHEESKIVLVAGIFGTEARMDGLDRNWQMHLERPLCGTKPPLKRFHMADCQASRREFVGWSRTETDYFCHQLRTVIIESGVSAYGVACARKDWDNLVVGDVRAFLGTAEGFCIRSCFVQTVAWAQRNTFDPKMTFIFDNRPSPVKRDAGVVFDAFQRETQEPALVGIAFLSSYDIRPLQAADMVAWEFYQHSNDVLSKGPEVLPRKEFLHLLSNMALRGHIATPKSIKNIEAYVKDQDQDVLKKLANHFTFFDPENPDFSYLAGRQPS
jgi:hypothetical protein